MSEILYTPEKAAALLREHGRAIHFTRLADGLKAHLGEDSSPDKVVEALFRDGNSCILATIQ